MIFWTIVMIFCAITGTYLLSKNYPSDSAYDFGFKEGLRLVFGIIFAGTAFALVLLIPSTVIDYNRFVESFEMQRQIVEEMPVSMQVVVDIADANKTLTEYQAQKQLFGSFSIIPESVFEIAPITGKNTAIS